MGFEALQQRDLREAFEYEGEQAWTVLCETRRGEDAIAVQFCVLAPRQLNSEVLGEDFWLPDLDDSAPGLAKSGTQDGFEYLRFGDDRGFEPLVIVQNHHGLRPRMLPQLSEEFRLYHNLWVNDSGAELIKVRADGSEEVVAEISALRVLVRTKYLLQFLAGKQMDLVLRVSSVLYADDPDEAATLGEIAPPNTQGDMRLSIYVSGDVKGRRRPSSHLLGRKLLAAPPREKSGIWPFDNPPENYHDFVIDEDRDGEPVRHTCDPNQLANYFGKNVGAPHYLTPVHFSRDVLLRYYEHTEKYSIEDGRLRCGSFWALPLDNNHPKYVVVFLGDLGRDLPESERPYWQTFNIVPDGDPSPTLVRRAFRGEPADPEAPDLRFKSAYNRFNGKWQKKFGWTLFREPDHGDEHVLQRLRVPLTNSQPEFEAQVMGLAQVLVDALNEKAIQKKLPTRVKDEKGISKLERWLQQEDYPSAERDIAFLRRLQRLRSKLTAHRKGSDYETVLADENVQSDAIQEVSRMLLDAERLLYSLASHAAIDLRTV